jgi:hypothetical protein
MSEAPYRFGRAAHPKANRLGREAVSSIYYSAAWTDCGCLISCWHHHRTVGDAVACIGSAGGYIVGVRSGVRRSLTAAEEVEFQCAVRSHRTDNLTVETTAAEAAVGDSGYAIMTRIRVGDCWTWTTWMRFETYAEAVTHARKGNKVVPFRSPKWAELRQRSEAASPILVTAPHRRKTRLAGGAGNQFRTPFRLKAGVTDGETQG